MRTQVWGEDERLNFAPKKDALAEWRGTWSVYKLQHRKTFVLLSNWSQGNADAHFIIFRASMHMLRRKNLSSEELDTPGRTRTARTVVRASGEVHTTRKHRCTITISKWRCKSSRTRLQSYHCENSVKNTDKPMSGPAVRSLTWPNNGSRFSAKREISYFLLSLNCRQILSDEPTPGNWRDSPKKTQVKRKSDNNSASDDRFRDLPERLEAFTDNLEGAEMLACTRTHFSWPKFGTSYECGIKEAQYFLSLLQKSKLRSMLANHDDMGPLQKTHWQSSTSSRKVWRPNNGRS